jgi:uncharacterized membrane protein
LRFLIGACVLVRIAAARGGLKLLPRPLPLAPLALMGLTGIAIYHVRIQLRIGLRFGLAGRAHFFALVPAAVAIAAVIALKETPVEASHRGHRAVDLRCGARRRNRRKRCRLTEPAGSAGLCMLGTVVAWAGYTVIAKQVADADKVVVIACVSVIGMAMLIPLAALELLHAPWLSPSLQGWLGTLFLGVVASALAFIVYSRALRELDASLVGAYINLDPIVGVLTAVLFLGETLRVWHILGGIIALAGMWLASTEADRNA